ncbi:MAG: hypothetical protein ABIR53_07480 [Paraperlucidibaca sp.]
MTTHTKLALAAAAALTLAACGGSSNNNSNVNDGFVLQVRALLGEMSEILEPAQALFDRLVATTPETGEPQAL